MRTRIPPRWISYRTPSIVLIALLLLGAGKLPATHTSPRFGARLFAGQSNTAGGAQGAGGNVIPAPPLINTPGIGVHQAVQDPGEPEYASDPKTGQSFRWDKSKKSWFLSGLTATSAETSTPLGFDGRLDSDGTPIPEPPIFENFGSMTLQGGSATDEFLYEYATGQTWPPEHDGARWAYIPESRRWIHFNGTAWIDEQAGTNFGTTGVVVKAGAADQTKAQAPAQQNPAPTQPQSTVPPAKTGAAKPCLRDKDCVFIKYYADFMNELAIHYADVVNQAMATRDADLESAAQLDHAASDWDNKTDPGDRAVGTALHRTAEATRNKLQNAIDNYQAARAESLVDYEEYQETEAYDGSGAGSTGTSGPASGATGTGTSQAGGARSPSISDAELAANLCERAKVLRDIAASDRQKAAATTDPQAIKFLTDDAKMMDGMAKEREDLANHDDPNTPCPPKTQATNGGNTGAGNGQVSQNTGGGTANNSSYLDRGYSATKFTRQCLIEARILEVNGSRELGVNTSRVSMNVTCAPSNPVTTIPGQAAVTPDKGILIQIPPPSFTIDSNLPLSGFSSTGSNLIISPGMSFTSPGVNPYSTTIFLPADPNTTGTTNFNFNFNLDTTGMNGKNAIVSLDGSPGVNLTSPYNAPPNFTGYVYNGQVLGFGPSNFSFGTRLDLQSQVNTMIKTRLPAAIDAMLLGCTAKTPTLTSFTPGANGSGGISIQFDCKGNVVPANSVVALTTTTGAITDGSVGCMGTGCTGSIPGTLTFDPHVMLFPLTLPDTKTDTATTIKTFKIDIKYKLTDSNPLSMGISLEGLQGVDIKSEGNGLPDWFRPTLPDEPRAPFTQYTPAFDRVTSRDYPLRNFVVDYERVFTPTLVNDMTTVPTVLPNFGSSILPLRFNNEFGGNIGGPIRRDNTFFFTPGLSSLNQQTGELNLETPGVGGGGYPAIGPEGGRFAFGTGVHFYGSLPGVQAYPETDSTGGLNFNPNEYQGLHLPNFTPRSYIRPTEYEWSLAQLMIAIFFPGSKSYCQNDFPSELQKLVGVTAACRPVRSARVVAAKAPTQSPAPTPAAADRPRLQTVSLRAGKYPAANESGGQRGGNSGGQSPVQAQQAGMAPKEIRVTFVATGKSTGPEAFDYHVDDPTKKVKSLRVPDGSVFVAIKPGIVQPMKVKAGDNEVQGPLPGYCAEFEKEPPPAGTEYRLADAATQQKYSFVRYISQAAGQMKEKNLFHPDNPNADGYFQSEVQSAIWIWINKWTQEQFAQHTVEKTKQNVETLKRTWTQEMETLVRNAVPGRWRDDAELLKEAQDLESAAAGTRGGRRGGRGGRGARGGRRGTQPEN
jgi:hypothetical protein